MKIPLRITVQIYCGNDAFCDAGGLPDGEQTAAEVRRIVSELGDNFARFCADIISGKARDSLPLFDVNGNKVGSIRASRH